MPEKYGWYSAQNYFKSFLVITNPHDDEIDIEVEYYDEKGEVLIGNKYRLKPRESKAIRLQEQKELLNRNGLVKVESRFGFLAQLNFYQQQGFSFIPLQEIETGIESMR